MTLSTSGAPAAEEAPAPVSDGGKAMNNFKKTGIRLGVVFVALLILNMFVNVMVYIDFLGMAKIKSYIDIYFMWISGFILLITYLKPWKKGGLETFKSDKPNTPEDKQTYQVTL
tara:strand:- start:684 stop:1025 length:342 start_codon:yes stop_codon:yes gene_type:complete